MSIQKKQSCPECGSFNNRGLTIDAIIIQDNKIVLIKRGLKPAKGQWALPGGHVEWDETVEDTVIKEVKEETGLDITSMNLFNVYSKPDRDPKQKITIVYAVKTSGVLHAGDDADSCKWFDINDLPDLPFDHGKIIEDYIEKSK
ncbi:MAG TPA: NUDIX hydrolase [Candidatus Nitrosocosmicus sp.]|nr:NUDIX hydrolase [Candidatus Nitrosocosmicus sp.]